MCLIFTPLFHDQNGEYDNDMFGVSRDAADDSSNNRRLSILICQQQLRVAIKHWEMAK